MERSLLFCQFKSEVLTSFISKRPNHQLVLQSSAIFRRTQKATYMDLFSSSICSFTLFSILYPLIILYNTVFGFLEKNWIFYLFKRVKYSSYLLTLPQNYFTQKLNWEYRKMKWNCTNIFINAMICRYAVNGIDPYENWSLFETQKTNNMLIGGVELYFLDIFIQSAR